MNRKEDHCPSNKFGEKMLVVKNNMIAVERNELTKKKFRNAFENVSPSMMKKINENDKNIVVNFYQNPQKYANVSQNKSFYQNDCASEEVILAVIAHPDTTKEMIEGIMEYHRLSKKAYSAIMWKPDLPAKTIRDAFIYLGEKEINDIFSDIKFSLYKHSHINKKFIRLVSDDFVADFIRRGCTDTAFECLPFYERQVSGYLNESQAKKILNASECVSESVIADIVNNKKLSDEIRNIAFCRGMDMKEVYNPTKYIVEEVYKITIDNLFENYKYENDIPYGAQQLLCSFLENKQLPLPMQVDLLSNIDYAMRHYPKDKFVNLTRSVAYMLLANAEDKKIFDFYYKNMLHNETLDGAFYLNKNNSHYVEKNLYELLDKASDSKPLTSIESAFFVYAVENHPLTEKTSQKVADYLNHTQVKYRHSSPIKVAIVNFILSENRSDETLNILKNKNSNPYILYLVDVAQELRKLKDFGEIHDIVSKMNDANKQFLYGEKYKGLNHMDSKQKEVVLQTISKMLDMAKTRLNDINERADKKPFKSVIANLAKMNDIIANGYSPQTREEIAHDLTNIEMRIKTYVGRPLFKLYLDFGDIAQQLDDLSKAEIALCKDGREQFDKKVGDEVI